MNSSFRWQRAPALSFALLLGAVLAHGGCGSDSGTGDDGGPGNDAPFGDVTLNPDAPPRCTSSADCDGGVCIGSSGVCCPSKQDVCSGQCCTGGSVCLFDACVTPGKPCHTANDCGPGQYCEPALGNPGDGGTEGGGVGPDGAVCTQPLPIEGRCLPLPPTCAPDAGASDGGCVAACEYHPPSGGPLTAKAKWTWGPKASAFPDFTDVWSTPTIGRAYDSNCDGAINELDSPDIIFVSGRGKTAAGVGTCCQCTGATPSACHTGVLRMLDGTTGQEIWSRDKASPGSTGFMGFSIAIGDIDHDGRIDIVAVTGEGFVVMLDGNGTVKRTSDKPIPGLAADITAGWGGGVAIADMDLDGAPEIAFGATVFTTLGNAITLRFTGTGGTGGGADEETSTLVDLDGAPDHHLELLAGNTAYKDDGTILWNRADLPNGFPGVGDFDKNGTPEAVLVASGKVWLLNGATGATVLGPGVLPGTGSGGPPTVASFDGMGTPEIGVAMATFYSVMKPNFVTSTIDVLWKMPNHDLSSSVTGSTVFDFQGDGSPDVIYADECFLWVFDGVTGKVRFAAPHTSFTATEASLLADVDGDGHAEMVMVSNGADPSSAGWGCLDALGAPTVINGVTWTPGPTSDKGYRGLVVFGDTANAWVGTRTLWNEHTYHVSNICDDRDTACAPPNVYGSIPKQETLNWTLPWLNDFRQNVQDKGIFNAPDAVLAVTVDCIVPLVAHVAVRNIGLAALPSGVNVGVFVKRATGDVSVGQGATTYALYPGQTDTIDITLAPTATTSDTLYAKILIDPNNPTFHECRTDNDTSADARPGCTR